MKMVHISKADKLDLKEILELQYLAYNSEAEIYDDYNIQPLKQTLEQLELEFEYQIILKAVIDDQIIGSVRAYEDNGTCKVGKLIVHPGYQNQGIGTQLITELERLMDHSNRLELFTGHKSHRNLYLYEKLGFAVYKSEVVHNNLTLIYMEKKINQKSGGHMNHLMNVETERLIIRPYIMNDLEQSYQLMQEKELFQYLHFDVMTFEEYEGLFNWLIQSYESAGDDFKYSFAIFLKGSGQFIGWVGVGTLDLQNEEKEIYYLIGKDFWNNGYAFEAAQEVVKYSFTTLGLNRIVAKVAAENKASKRIIEKLGFDFEYVLEDLPEEHAECNGELYYTLTHR